MKRQFLIAILHFLCSVLLAQPVKHVKWSTQYLKNGDKGEIIIKADIDKGWHTYSQKPSEGPIPTEFTFKPSSDYSLEGPTAESESKEEFDKTFEAKVYSFSGTAEFKQFIKVRNRAFVDITVDYMVCSDAMCIKEGPVQLQVEVQ